MASRSRAVNGGRTRAKPTEGMAENRRAERREREGMKECRQRYLQQHACWSMLSRVLSILVGKTRSRSSAVLLVSHHKVELKLPSLTSFYYAVGVRHATLPAIRKGKASFPDLASLSGSPGWTRALCPPRKRLTLSQSPPCRTSRQSSQSNFDRFNPLNGSQRGQEDELSSTSYLITS